MKNNQNNTMINKNNEEIEKIIKILFSLYNEIIKISSSFESLLVYIKNKPEDFNMQDIKKIKILAQRSLNILTKSSPQFSKIVQIAIKYNIRNIEGDSSAFNLLLKDKKF